MARPSAITWSITTGSGLDASNCPTGTVNTPLLLGNHTSPWCVRSPAGFSPPHIWIVSRPSDTPYKVTAARGDDPFERLSRSRRLTAEIPFGPLIHRTPL